MKILQHDVSMINPSDLTTWSILRANLLFVERKKSLKMNTTIWSQKKNWQTSYCGRTKVHYLSLWFTDLQMTGSGLPYLFGWSAIGNVIRLFAIDSTLTKTPIETFDLSHKAQRLEMANAFRNILRIIPELYHTISNPDRTKLISFPQPSECTCQCDCQVLLTYGIDSRLIIIDGDRVVKKWKRITGTFEHEQATRLRKVCSNVQSHHLTKYSEANARIRYYNEERYTSYWPSSWCVQLEVAKQYIRRLSKVGLSSKFNWNKLLTWDDRTITGPTGHDIDVSSISSRQLKEVLICILKALSGLHACGIVHRDVRYDYLSHVT